MASRRLSENGFRVKVAESLGAMKQELVEHNRRIGNVETGIAENTKKLDKLIVTVTSNKAVSKTRIRDVGVGAVSVTALAAFLQVIINLRQVLAWFGVK